MNEEFEVLGLGAIKSPFDIRDYTIKALLKSQLPEEFELPTLPVKNQFTTGSCVAQALALLVEYHHRRQHNEEVQFSTEFIYANREDTDHQEEGMILRQAFACLKKYGDVKYEDMKGNNIYPIARANFEKNDIELLEKAFPNRISAYFRINSELELKTALKLYGYVVISMPWYKKYKLDKDGCYCPDLKAKKGSHAVVIYGWNDKGWKVQNSWGKSWGKNGRFILKYDFKYNEAWGAIDTITDDSGLNKKEYGPFRSALCRACNWIVNLATSIVGWFKK